ncbi:MAG: iron-regulated protein [Gammaproteobacteria bacterium]|nr:iron-regulated protein [Gammaproteobacteria bacterium]
MGKRFAVMAATMIFSASAAATTAPTPKAVVEHYAVVVYASYEDTLNAARHLQQAVDRFVAAPSADGLQEARKQWLAAREWYGQTEAFRFYGGPIDSATGPEGRLNAWPVDEAYIDAVKDRADSGIINNPKIAITKKTLMALNEKDGEENISAGWHAIEFLLWGQDQDINGPGNRPYTDFVDDKAPNAVRRRQYLKVATDLLLDDLTQVTKAWAPTAKNYRARFVANPANLGKMLTGIGVLSRGELAGERIEVALDTKSQEDEHSCFSDNTHRDVVANSRGIRNVWRGEFKRADGSVLTGPSLRELVAAKNKAAAERVDSDVDASVQAAESIPAPFDRAIVVGSPGRPAVEQTVVALKRQAEGLVVAAGVLGIKRLNTAVPE